MAVQPGKDETTFTVGELRLRSLYRHFGADSGPSLEVYLRGEDEQWRRALRYDCFHTYPHRHIFYADGRADRVPWGPGGTDDAIAATAAELADDLPGLLRRAGFPDLAAQVSPQQLRPAIDRAIADMRQRRREHG